MLLAAVTALVLLDTGADDGGALVPYEDASGALTLYAPQVTVPGGSAENVELANRILESFEVRGAEIAAESGAPGERPSEGSDQIRNGALRR